MSDEEVREFEVYPHFSRAICIRRYDDRGKQPEMMTPALDELCPGRC